MKITNVTAVPVRAPQMGQLSGYLPYGDELSSKEVRAAYASCFVKVATDEGMEGVGESLVREVPEATATIIDKLLKPVVLGNDPFDVEVIWEKMFSTLRTRGHNRGFFVEALSGVDIAIWDLMGKKVNKPVHKLLGGARSDRLKAYASGILFGTPKEVANEALRRVAQGHDQLKLKVGMGEEEDVNNVKAVRDAVGSGVDIMVDANSAFNAHEAIRMGTKFERFECYWFEEPVPPDDINGYVEVSRKLDIPIAGGESNFTRFDFRDLIARDALDVVMPDIGRAGGISECRKIAALASAFDKSYSPHVGLSGAGVRAASLHLAASLPKETFLTYEVYDVKRRSNPLASLVTKENIEKFKEGYVQVPQKAGLGIEFNEAELRKVAANTDYQGWP